MATSGTYNFKFSVEEIIEKALQMVGGELSSAEDLRQARKSLSLVLIDMESRGAPLAQIQHKTFTVSAGDVDYTLPSDVLDVLDVTVERDGTETPVERIGLFKYHKIPNKDSPGIAAQYAIERARTETIMYLYLAPENSTDVIDYWCITRIQDPGVYTNDVDINYKYIPAVTFGLAYYMSLERDEKTEYWLAKRKELMQNYLGALEVAAHDDRERASFTISPYSYFRRR
jgi:hypothetical protein